MTPRHDMTRWTGPGKGGHWSAVRADQIELDRTGAAITSSLSTANSLTHSTGLSTGPVPAPRRYHVSRRGGADGPADGSDGTDGGTDGQLTVQTGQTVGQTGQTVGQTGS